MPIPSSAKTIGKNAVIPGRETFCVVDPQTGGAATIEPFEAPRLSEALTRWVNDGRRKDVALMVGGPKHMELVAVPPSGNGVVRFPRQQSTMIRLVDFHTEQYTRIKFEGSSELPFDIYEHDSVRGANVQRRAEQLDRELAEVSEDYSRESQAERTAISLADKAIASVNAAQNSLDEARKNREVVEKRRQQLASRCKDVAKKLTKLQNERTQISYDHGI